MSEDTTFFIESDTNIKELVIDIVKVLREKVRIPNFWKKSSEVKKLQGTIDDKLDFCNITALSNKHEKICSDILNLAKKRERDLQEETE